MPNVKRLSRPGARISLYVVVGIACAFAVAPIYWVIITSLKTYKQMFSTSPLLPAIPSTLQNYETAFSRGGPEGGGADILRFLANSSIVAVSVTLLCLAIGSLAAYSLARFRFRGNRAFAFGVLVLRMMPPIALVLPYYILMSRVHLLDSLLALIITYTAFDVPFVIWMMRAFFREVPAEVEESAYIDGCSRFGAFLRIALPLAAPGLAATSIFCLLGSWNEFMFAVILTSTRHATTTPVLIAKQITQFGLPWELICAMTAILLVPILAFSILVQKHLIRGLTFGAVKG